VFCVYSALRLGLRAGSFRTHCGIPRKTEMQAHCNIVASIFARHAEVLGSIPGGEFRFFAQLFYGFRISAAPPLHNHGATERGWGNHARRGRESTPRRLPNRTLRLKRDARRGGCNTSADWRSGSGVGLIAHRSEDRSHAPLFHRISQDRNTKQDE